MLKEVLPDGGELVDVLHQAGHALVLVLNELHVLLVGLGETPDPAHGLAKRVCGHLAIPDVVVEDVVEQVLVGEALQDGLVGGEVEVRED